MTLDIEWTASTILNRSLRTKGNEVNRVANQKIINLNIKQKIKVQKLNANKEEQRDRSQMLIPNENEII